MKIGQIDVLFAVTRSKIKRRVTYEDSFKDIMYFYRISFKTVFIGYPAFLFRPIYVLKLKPMRSDFIQFEVAWIWIK